MVDWALTQPQENLANFTRARIFQSHLSQRNRTQALTGYPGYRYIQSRLWYSPGSFEPMSDILQDITNYATMSGDDSFGSKGLPEPNRETLVQVIHSHFNKMDVVYKKRGAALGFSSR